MNIESSSASQKQVLILEDDAMVAMLLEAMLEEAGYQVAGPVGKVADAMNLVETQRIDTALLDVNLRGGESGYSVADALILRGIPFAFVTGYGSEALSAEYRHQPTLQKPFHQHALVALLAALAATP